jgi:hypothetical protein
VMTIAATGQRDPKTAIGDDHLLRRLR